MAPESDILVWEAEWANYMDGSFECLAGEDTGNGAAVWAIEGTGRHASSKYDAWIQRERNLGMMHYTNSGREAGPVPALPAHVGDGTGAATRSG